MIYVDDDAEYELEVGVDSTVAQKPWIWTAVVIRNKDFDDAAAAKWCAENLKNNWARGCTHWFFLDYNEARKFAGYWA